LQSVRNVDSNNDLGKYEAAELKIVSPRFAARAELCPHGEALLTFA
jgi:hypothetical protein